MTASVTQQTLGELVRENIRHAQVFERFGIDYCCRGDRSLADACHDHSLDLDEVRHALDGNDAISKDAHADWTTVPLGLLIDDIVATHHDYLRRELPRLENLMAKVAAVHGLMYCHLHDFAPSFVQLEQQLQAQMRHEEQVVFPLLRQFDQAETEPQPACHEQVFGLKAEHDAAIELLDRIRRLCRDYTAPATACRTYQALMAGLKQLEQDLHLHLHKENNVLFHRVVQRESAAVLAP